MNFITYPFVISVMPSIAPSSPEPDVPLKSFKADFQILYSSERTVTLITAHWRKANPPHLSLRNGSPEYSTSKWKFRLTLQNKTKQLFLTAQQNCILILGSNRAKKKKKKLSYQFSIRKKKYSH